MEKNKYLTLIEMFESFGDKVRVLLILQMLNWNKR